MNAVSNEKRPTSMAFYIRPTGQLSRGFKVHNVIMCESEVQVVVSLGRHWVLFALGRHWVLTKGTWHVLLQSGNVFELGGITMLIAIDSLSARIKPWWRCENLESTSWILVWIRRRPFAGLEFMFTYFYVHVRCFAITKLYHYTRERSRETTLHTNPYSFQV